MRSVEFTRRFSAAHRIWNDDSPCRNIHGHNYLVEVYIETSHELNEQGFVLSFDSIKAHIDALDHCLILDKADPIIDPLLKIGGNRLYLLDGQPSTENLAQHISVQIAGVIGAKRPGVRGHVRVKLTEGPSIAAWGESSIHPLDEQAARRDAA